MKKAWIGIVIAIVGLLMVGSSVHAQPYDAFCKLETAVDGFEIGAEGKALLHKRIIERCSVRVSADLKDGAVLVVQATAKDGETMDIGSISMLLGSGALQLDTVRNGNSPVFPVEKIKAIAVKRNGKTVAEGKCHSMRPVLR